MLKNIVLLIGFSVAAMIFKGQLTHVLQSILAIHDKIADALGVIFSSDAEGSILQAVLSLLVIPAVLGVVAAMLHWFLKQEHFPHTMTVIWVSWTVILVTMLSQVSA